MHNNLEIIVLAAGRGKRMSSELPKVMHRLAGKPLLSHVLSTARKLKPLAIHVVVGHKADLIADAFRHSNDIKWVHQDKQLGTGHAVETVLPSIKRDSTVLVLFGDVPLITLETLQQGLDISASTPLTLLTATVEKPRNFGRIIRDQEKGIVGIVEEKDANDLQRKCKEVNCGVMFVHAVHLIEWINQLDANNAQQEYYLTDIVAKAVRDNVHVKSFSPFDVNEIVGINSLRDLVRVERIYQQALAEQFLDRGILIRDPARFDVRGRLHCDEKCEIDVNVIFEGDVFLGKGVVVHANCYIKDCVISDYTVVYPHSHLEGAHIGLHCSIGPFARVRPGSTLDEYVRLGNFVELKKAYLKAGAKANHLSYLGDVSVGVASNIGAGCIVCNYDGEKKHSTSIGDHAFIGSNTTLVSPINVGESAFIGAGSTVTKDVPTGALAIERDKQRHIAEWKQKKKSEE